MGLPENAPDGLIDQYEEMHRNEKRFPGYSIGAYVGDIQKLIVAHKPDRLLDFGSGKGFQYLVRRVHERWGGLLPYCYDPGVRQLREIPEGKFGGVICSDVMEHIEEKDISRVLDQILDKCEPGGFVFLGISCRPSTKSLPDGRDCHVTIRPPSWWINKIIETVNTDLCLYGPIPHWPWRVVVNFDVAGHFDEPGDPWDSHEMVMD